MDTEVCGLNTEVGGLGLRGGRLKLKQVGVDVETGFDLSLAMSYG